MYHERQQKKRKKKSTAAHNTRQLKTDSDSLWTHKDLGDDSASLSITVISECTQLFLRGDIGGPGHTMLSVPLLCSLMMNFSARVAQHCKCGLPCTEAQQTTTACLMLNWETVVFQQRNLCTPSLLMFIVCLVILSHYLPTEDDAKKLHFFHISKRIHLSFTVLAKICNRHQPGDFKMLLENDVPTQLWLGCL